MVRTSPSQGGNMGSNPIGAASFTNVFLFFIKEVRNFLVASFVILKNVVEYLA